MLRLLRVGYIARERLKKKYSQCCDGEATGDEQGRDPSFQHIHLPHVPAYDRVHAVGYHVLVDAC
jgi:hypothetical protein